MSARNENENSGKDWSDDPRLTAYALGELEPAESAELEAEMAGDAGARAQVEELRAFAGSLEQHFAAETAPELLTEQRGAIEARASGAGQAPVVMPAPIAVRRMRAREYAAIAATVMVVGVGASVFLVQGGYLGSAADGSAATMAPASERVARTAVADRPGAEYERLDRLGYSGDSEVASGEAPRPAASRANDTRARGEDAFREVALHEPAGEISPERLKELRSLGYVGSDDGGELSSRYELKDEVQVEEPILRDFENRAARPNSREAYERIYENPFKSPSTAPFSTFSIDVDTASYANVRRMIEDGHLPPPDAVRIEEFVNYFPYDYSQPVGEHPFSVNVEVGSAPWAPTHRLVRIGLKGKETLPAERRPSNLVFLMDVSGSMNSPDKLPLLKRALHMLVQELDERDTVSIVVYAGASGLALPPTRCDRSVDVHMALERLQAGGSTNGGAGIELAYDLAAKHFLDGGINRVILATDGDFNVGVSDDGSLVRLIEEKAGTGVFLSVLGFGTGNLQDSKMEKLADKGNGNYAYIDSVMEARKVLVDQMGSTLETIAKDVKVQVEFNPTEVQAYRLIGYENRLLAAEDFKDDTKDAGEIGAGHCVTALYEVVPQGVPFELPGVDDLIFQTSGEPSAEAFTGAMLLLKLRYKQPEADISTELVTRVSDSGADFQELSADTRWAATVAGFGMVLRDSSHKGNLTLDDVSRWALESAADDPGGYRAQFIGLVGKAKALR